MTPLKIGDIYTGNHRYPLHTCDVVITDLTDDIVSYKADDETKVYQLSKFNFILRFDFKEIADNSPLFEDFDL